MDTDQRESIQKSEGKRGPATIIVIIVIVVILILLLLCCIFCGLPIISGIWNTMMGV